MAPMSTALSSGEPSRSVSMRVRSFAYSSKAFSGEVIDLEHVSGTVVG